jgi:hypothetical protein
MQLTKTILPLLVLIVAATSAFAQDRKPLSPDEQDQYVVSARAGVINIAEGEVSFKRDQADWAKLISGDALQAGDTVKTSANGRVEILLTPGNYLRLAENTEFVLMNPASYKFKINILRGSAIIEASSIDGLMTIATPKTEFAIIKEGLYRFNVAADGNAEVIVRKGRVQVADRVVKGDKRARVRDGLFSQVSVDSDLVDDFDLWSKSRAKTLLAINKRLSQRNLGSNVALSFVASAWVFDPFYGYYTFLPYNTGFSSPYGGSYPVCNPNWRHWPHHNNGGGWGNGGHHNGNPGSGVGSGNGSGNGSGGGRSGGGRSDGGANINSGGSRPGNGSGNGSGSGSGGGRSGGGSSNSSGGGSGGGRSGGGGSGSGGGGHTGGGHSSSPSPSYTPPPAHSGGGQREAGERPAPTRKP